MSDNIIQLGTAADAIAAHEPTVRMIIACEVARLGNDEAWEPRTYEITRTEAHQRTRTGMEAQWRISFGDNGWLGYEHVAGWENVVSWFCKMVPRNIEIIVE